MTVQALVFILRVQHGFTQKLHKEASSDTTFKAFLNSHYGSPPLVIGYQTVILVAGLPLALLMVLVLRLPCRYSLIFYGSYFSSLF